MIYDGMDSDCVTLRDDAIQVHLFCPGCDNRRVSIGRRAINGRDAVCNCGDRMVATSIRVSLSKLREILVTQETKGGTK